MVSKLSFLQEKSSFHMKHPEHSDLAFYKWYTQQYPDESIGWYHLGREWQARGDVEQALAAHRRAMVLRSDPYAESARYAYQDLLRERRRDGWQKRARLLVASALFLYLQFALLPGLLNSPLPAAEPATGATEAPATGIRDPDPPAAASTGVQAVEQQPHVEVIAVPSSLGTAELRDQVKRYLETRRPGLNQPYTLLIVPEVPGTPLFTHLPFYRPQKVRALFHYNPATRTLIQEQWFDHAESDSQDAAVQTAQGNLAREQVVMQHVVALRNALYRHYQATGGLPATLDALAGAYPANSLPQIPFPPAWLGLDRYVYYPERFQSTRAWDSMREVLPLPGYPEPVQPLEPLQLYLYQESRTMELRSGPHLIRSYPVGLGKNNATPDGYYTILQKINKPRGHDNIFGTRGMVFRDDGYAIHGTNNPDSIGTYASLGCVRLLNIAVEELYSLVSLGTEVIISALPAPGPVWSNPVPFIMEAGAEEETPQIVYRWLH